MTLAIAAAIGLGAAGCGDDTVSHPPYGVHVPDNDLSATPDLAKPDLSSKD